MNRKPNKGSFKKGNPGGGRKPLPPEIKKISNATKPQIILAYWKIVNLSIDEAKEYKPVNLLEAGMMRCLFDFAKTGRTAEISRIWAECHGRPTEYHSVDFEDDNNIVININGVDGKKN